MSLWGWLVGKVVPVEVNSKREGGQKIERIKDE